LCCSPLWACDRDSFGSYDATRAELLDPVKARGWFTDPYDGLTYPASQATVDHVVSICESWIYGAKDWTPERRNAFANDRANLLVVSRSNNSSKSNRPPPDWLPAAVRLWAPYLAQRALVREKWALRVPETTLAFVRCVQRYLRENRRGFRPGKWGC
jgi:hypothetical protein